jgi:hypothetical protein
MSSARPSSPRTRTGTSSSAWSDGLSAARCAFCTFFNLGMAVVQAYETKRRTSVTGFGIAPRTISRPTSAGSRPSARLNGSPTRSRWPSSEATTSAPPTSAGRAVIPAHLVEQLSTALGRWDGRRQRGPTWAHSRQPIVFETGGPTRSGGGSKVSDIRKSLDRLVNPTSTSDRRERCRPLPSVRASSLPMVLKVGDLPDQIGVRVRHCVVVPPARLVQGKLPADPSSNELGGLDCCFIDPACEQFFREPLESNMSTTTTFSVLLVT